MMEGASNSFSLVVKGRDGDDECCSIMDLPPGFRFHPTDEEIITHYLTHKVMNSSFSARAIGEVDLNKCEPWDLPKKAKLGEKEWYFFCQRDRKYPTGMRTNRATESGYWKATGKDKEIYNKGKERKERRPNLIVGMKKTLVFYKGRAPKGEKTNWVMHEYRLQGNFSYYNFPKLTKDEWVVCRIFHKSTGIKRSPINNTEETGRGGDPSLTSRMNFLGGDDDDDDDLFLLDCPLLPPLMDPPDPYSNNNERPAAGAGSSFSTDIGEQDEIKGTANNSSSAAAARLSSDHGDYNYLSYFSTNLNDHQLLEKQQEDHKINNFFITSQSNSNYYSTTRTNYQACPSNHPTPESYDQIQRPRPNPVFPPNLGYLHHHQQQQQERMGIMGVTIPSFTAAAAAGGSSSSLKLQQVTELSKMGQFSSNQSMVSVSQDTVTTDLTAETSSAISKKHVAMGSNMSYEDDIDDDPSVGVGPISDLDDYLWNCY